jgi:hypothetical protein
VQPFPSTMVVTFPWVASGDEVVAVNGLPSTEGEPKVGGAEALVPSSPQSIRPLGEASYVVDASTSGDVWLVISPYLGGVTLGGRHTCTVQEVTLGGRVVVPARTFPCGWTVDGPALNGLLVSEGETSNHLNVWDPKSDKVVASFGFTATPVSVDGDSGTWVIWNSCPSVGPCLESAANLLAGGTEELPSLPSGWTATSSYLLAPSGPFVAVIAVSSTTAKSFPHRVPSGITQYAGVQAVPSLLLVYNLRTDSLVESRSLTAASVPEVRWSEDSGYLFLMLDLRHIKAVPLWSDSAPIRVVNSSVAAESFLPVASGR